MEFKHDIDWFIFPRPFVVQMFYDRKLFFSTRNGCTEIHVYCIDFLIETIFFFIILWKTKGLSSSGAELKKNAV